MAGVRDQLAIKKWREEWAAQEEAEREAAMKPVRDAEEQLKRTSREFANKLREIALTDRIDDYDKQALAGLSRSTEGHGSERAFKVARSWAATEPKYLRLADEQRIEVGKMLAQFLERNSLDPTDELNWSRAWMVLSHVGAIPEPPEEPQQVATEPEPEQPITPTAAAEPETAQGWDVVTGEPRIYSQFEIRNLSAEQYRRAFRLCGNNRPVYVYPRI